MYAYGVGPGVSSAAAQGIAARMMLAQAATATQEAAFSGDNMDAYAQMGPPVTTTICCCIKHTHDPARLMYAPAYYTTDCCYLFDEVAHRMRADPDELAFWTDMKRNMGRDVQSFSIDESVKFFGYTCRTLKAWRAVTWTPAIVTTTRSMGMARGLACYFGGLFPMIYDIAMMPFRLLALFALVPLAFVWDALWFCLTACFVKRRGWWRMLYGKLVLDQQFSSSYSGGQTTTTITTTYRPAGPTYVKAAWKDVCGSCSGRTRMRVLFNKMAPYELDTSYLPSAYMTMPFAYHWDEQLRRPRVPPSQALADYQSGKYGSLTTLGAADASERKVVLLPNAQLPYLQKGCSGSSRQQHGSQQEMQSVTVNPLRAAAAASATPV